MKKKKLKLKKADNNFKNLCKKNNVQNNKERRIIYKMNKPEKIEIKL